jgi:hypothetical protein
VKRLIVPAAFSFLSAGIAACAGGTPAALPASKPQAQARTILASSSYGTLEFSAGMLTISGTKGTIAASGLNIVSTLRSGSKSASLVSTPTITGPFDFSAFSMANRNAGIAGAGPGDPYATVFGSTQPNSPSGLFFGAPSVFDASHNELTGTAQSLPSSGPGCDSAVLSVPAPYVSCGAIQKTPSDRTFGQGGGVFGNGFQPANFTTSGTRTYAPYGIPFFATTANPHVIPFQPWGGPPGFDSSNDGSGDRNGLYPPGVFGVITGITAMQLPQPASTLTGTYSLKVVAPASSGTTTTWGPISATVNAAKALPAIARPKILLDGKGGATVTVPKFPAGVTEEYIFIIDNGPNPSAAGTSADANCQGSFGTSEAPVYYTLVFTTPGTFAPPTTTPKGGVENVGLPDSIGPFVNSGGSPTICGSLQNSTAVRASVAGDSYTVIGLGIDYDLYDAMLPKNQSQTPTIVGAAGQDDMTMSLWASATAGSY